MFETRLGILVQTLIWETSKHGQRGAIPLGGRELVRGLRGTRTFHLFHLFCKFPWIFAWFGFVGVALLVCVFLLAFSFGEICFLSSFIPVVDRQCLALVRQCRKKNFGDSALAVFVAGAAFSDSILAVFVAGATFGDSVLAAFVADAAFSDSVLAVFVAGAAFGDSVLAVFVAGAAFSDSVLAVFVADTAFGNVGMEGIKPRVWRNAES